MSEETRKLVSHGIYVMWDGKTARTTTYHLQEMIEVGIEDPMMFINGYKDAIGDNGFNESNLSYICGFKYGSTGIIDIKKKSE